MSNPQTPDVPSGDREPVDVDTARDLLDRAVRFLTRCQSDPEGAIDEEDPTELIEKLRGLDLRYLSGGPPEAEEEKKEGDGEIRRSA